MGWGFAASVSAPAPKAAQAASTAATAATPLETLLKAPAMACRAKLRTARLNLAAGKKLLKQGADLRHMHGGNLPDDFQIHVGVVVDLKIVWEVATVHVPEVC